MIWNFPFFDNPPEKLGGGGIFVGKDGGLCAGLLCPKRAETNKEKTTSSRPKCEKFFGTTISFIYEYFYETYKLLNIFTAQQKNSPGLAQTEGV